MVFLVSHRPFFQKCPCSLLLCHNWHLFCCVQSKIVRVLNLWQKNSVFKSDIIQPLLDMAAGIPPSSTTPVLPSSAAPINNTTPGRKGHMQENYLLWNCISVMFHVIIITFCLFRHSSYTCYSGKHCPGSA